MTKFKILQWALKLFICLYLTGIVCTIYFIYTTSFNPMVPSIYIYHFYASIASMLLSASGLYFLQKSCSMFIERSYFNSKSELYLKRGGIILMASAILGFVLDFTPKESASKENLSNVASKIGYNTTLLIMGFAIIAVADIIKKGVNLKRENDLTI